MLVNDFGELPIDQDLIAAKKSDVLTLANGCACCSMGGDLYQAFDAALNYSPAPDHLLIEASGVAEPKRIANFAKAEPDLSLNGIVTMVDAVNFEAARANDRLSDTIGSQIGAAHLLLLNKCDLATEQERGDCRKILRTMNDRAPILNIAQGMLSPDVFFNINLDEFAGEDSLNDRHVHNHEVEFTRWSFQINTEIDIEDVRKILSQLPASILRVKGIFRVPSDTRLWTVHVVGSHVDIFPLSPPQSFSGKLGFVAIGAGNSNLADILDEAFSRLQ